MNTKNSSAANTSESHVYLVRHGETSLNADGRLRGLADPPLNDTGVHEAEDLAATIAGFTPRFIVSSPLKRAVRTAEIIGRAAGVQSAVDDRFNDRDYGPLTGELKAEVVARWGSVDEAPGVEPLGNVLARARPALDAIVAEKTGGPIVIVTHDAVIRALIAAIDPTRSDLRSPTASWNHLTVSAGDWHVLEVDQTPES